jgi:uncharacterized protein YgbK (DUF1537 family)
VLTSWDVEALLSALRSPDPLFYVLTNSRALARGDAVRRAAEVAANLSEAARHAGVSVALISRSDSTLRGHYPWKLEPFALADRPLLPRADLLPSGVPTPGLVLAVSYVQRTAEQLSVVLALPGLRARELPVPRLLGAEDAEVHQRAIGEWASRTCAAGQTALIYTSRERVTAHAGRDHAAIAALVSRAIARLAHAEAIGRHIAGRDAPSRDNSRRDCRRSTRQGASAGAGAHRGARLATGSGDAVPRPR